MSVFDTAIKSYSPPFCVRTVDEAVRTFSQEVRSDQSRLSKSPADFVLFHLGSFEDDNAEYALFPAPARVVSGNEVVPPRLSS